MAEKPASGTAATPPMVENFFVKVKDIRAGLRKPGTEFRGDEEKEAQLATSSSSVSSAPIKRQPQEPLTKWQNTSRVMLKFLKFIGPGFMIAVAYIDPGNYSTDIAAGADSQFKLLFMVLMSNIIAIFFQSQCILMGTVTGLTLAENCRKYMPRWMCYLWYLFSEVSIIATDLSEVIGTAIGINLLIPGLNLTACVGLTMLDVVFVMIFYRPKGQTKSMKAFEMFVAALIFVIVISFCVELSFIKGIAPGHILAGFLPSGAVVQGNGLSLSAGILGATVMPHSLFLGSGMVQPRLAEFDKEDGVDVTASDYLPSIHAIRGCMKYSIAELILQLFTFGLFVNAAILIVGGAFLFDTPDSANADLFSIHALLSDQINPVAGGAFALALLLAGLSAGIICTVASQITTEGFLDIHMPPWVMRLITRLFSVTPSLIIAAQSGREGLGNALNGSQVCLSILLPFISLPLVYLTGRAKYMTVSRERLGDDAKELIGDDPKSPGLAMNTGVVISSCAWIIWIIVSVMNIALIIQTAMGG